MHRRLTSLLGLCLVVLLAACGTPPDPEQAPDGPTETPIPPTPTLLSPTAVPTPVSTTITDRYTVRSGDTLGRIAQRFRVELQDLMKLNGISNPNAIQIGQVLKIPQQATRMAPGDFLLPDSEVAYSPAYASFDVTVFANQANGYLATYREKVDGEMLTGPQIVQLVAERYSVGPRVLLALLEFEGSWVTSPWLTQNQLSYPMGLIDNSRATLFYQTSWAANRLNEGYYGKISGQLGAFQFKDRTRARVAPTANPGTAAIQNVLAQTTNWDTWLNQIAPGGYVATYRRLFGEPVPIEPLVPQGLRQPLFRLPWNDGGTWYFTGGPHSPWGDLAAWSAIDLTPGDVAGGGGCSTSKDWALAVAPGRVVRAEHGRVILSLSNDNFQGNGWALLYMHIATNGRAAVGTQLNTGDHIGHASCEGGFSNASHLHLARMYNGQWLDTVSIPFVLSGWQIVPDEQEYDGKMVRGSESREALDSRNEFKNAVVANDAP